MKKKYHKTKTTLNNILDRVDQWMDIDAPDCELHEYLGITKKSCDLWYATGRLS